MRGTRRGFVFAREIAGTASGPEYSLFTPVAGALMSTPGVESICDLDGPRAWHCSRVRKNRCVEPRAAAKVELKRSLTLPLQGGDAQL